MGLRRSISEFLKQFDDFAYLWKDSRQEVLEKFLATNPTIDDFEVQLDRYDQCIAAIDSIPAFRVVGMHLIYRYIWV